MEATLSYRVDVTRSLIYKGKPAPKGCFYFIAQARDKSYKYTMYQLVQRGQSDEDEEAIKQLLCERLLTTHNLV